MPACTASTDSSAVTFVHGLRGAAPYINAHRGKTFVIMFGGEAVEHAHFNHLIHDFVLLHSLGIKLVLVHGARPQIEANLRHLQLGSPLHNGMRITPRAALPCILEAVGAIRLHIEAQLSMGLINSPMYGARIDAISGNFVTARPYGVRDGVDYQMTGEVRSIDTTAINNNLQHGHLVVLGSMGYSATGEVFNLRAEEVALNAAVALQADKLILLGQAAGIDTQEGLVTELTASQADTILASNTLCSEQRQLLHGASLACQRGVARAHILSYAQDGALLTELFSRDGTGTLVSADPFEHIRCAHIGDVGGLISLLEPLEAQGILVKRSREHLEQDIDHFSVIERDGLIVGCAALYPLDAHSAEVASVAIHPQYRSGQRGSDLLDFLQTQARQQERLCLYALTTRTAHWFIEHGFIEVPPEALPEQRQQRYQNGRNSKVLQKRV